MPDVHENLSEDSPALVNQSGCACLSPQYWGAETGASQKLPGQPMERRTEKPTSKKENGGSARCLSKGKVVVA